jgi:hypothetical protein
MDKMLESSTVGPPSGEFEIRRGVQVFRSNPFMPDVQVKSMRVTNKRGDMMMVSRDTGEVGARIAGFWETEEVDGTKFVKLFIKGVAALTELTSSGVKVFSAFYTILQRDCIGKDIVYLTFSEVDQTLNPMAASTFSRGIRELIGKGFLAARPAPGMYWINPNYVFNGDRLAFVKSYHLKKLDGVLPAAKGFADSQDAALIDSIHADAESAFTAKEAA